ncbi:uncharacterized protein BT62DRAFT_1002023 [Guyanagaster necrorhizus]|uniref:Uncharacterized protein n=1 Tax=Guyanagaster necrorhizus TaxID=856835 RepID=A0A9P8AVU7_9AGAR|nr:uncharacterized protein BT62DRAFT_1002023 [Guyanagaster necrorhizus MCA 3950]KAG7449705.1 hypothetical protein BT62DRAFT_1002023 [Guyanagaster necrorhizus MCA 3950]
MSTAVRITVQFPLAQRTGSDKFLRSKRSSSNEGRNRLLVSIKENQHRDYYLVNIWTLCSSLYLSAFRRIKTSLSHRYGSTLGGIYEYIATPRERSIGGTVICVVLHCPRIIRANSGKHELNSGKGVRYKEYNFGALFSNFIHGPQKTLWKPSVDLRSTCLSELLGDYAFTVAAAG